MSKYIKWSDKFVIGVAAVDHEHQELVQLVNNAIATMEEGNPVDVTVTALGEVYAKIAAHFALEELMMRREAYREYMLHKDDHERLLDEIRDLMDAYEDGDYESNRDTFIAEIAEWFTGHFSTMDARLHACFPKGH